MARCQEYIERNRRAEIHRVREAEVAFWADARADFAVEGVDAVAMAAECEGEDFVAEMRGKAEKWREELVQGGTKR